MPQEDDRVDTKTRGSIEASAHGKIQPDEDISSSNVDDDSSGEEETDWEENCDVMRFPEESQLVSLRSVLGSNICYGIRASRAKLSDKAPLQIPSDCAVNCVAAPGDDELNEDNDKFVRAPPASQRGFNLIHNGNNVLSLRIRHRKFHFETEDGKSIPLQDCCLPQHFQDILKPQNWGFWINQTVSTKKGALFDHEHQLHSITDVFDDPIEAKALFANGRAVSFHNLDYVKDAIAMKQGVDN
jgi:hypothetical protein